MDIHPSQPEPAPERAARSRDATLRAELERRLQRPQRHRLLHGYPMAPLMGPATIDRARWMTADPSRPLLVGVLPHTACNPKVRGCGFCTFPHERYERASVERVVAAVVREIETVLGAAASLGTRKIGAVYFGGGTANLTPPGAFASLAGTLARAFDLHDAEISLEGVPRYFLLHGGRLLDTIGDLGARSGRISMGVQTLDPAWLSRMGRDAFGDAPLVRDVVAEAHRRGFTASADMLVNLPGRTPVENLRDIERCAELGVDQICVYNLVLGPELDVPWASERSLLDRRPPNDEAYAVWRAARRLLVEAGFVQTTLTNFERRGTRSFVYELASFDPASWDAIGFGPAAISTFTDADGLHAAKWMNRTAGEAYASAIADSGDPTGAGFTYTPRDLRLLHLTRGCAATRVDVDRYRSFFGTEVEDDFGAELDVLTGARLVRRRGARIELTPRGMFFADAVAGTLASARVAELRRGGAEPASHHAHMG